MQAKDYLPLTETSFFILLSLAVTPKHGYAIIKEVEQMSSGRVVLAAGTLYTALRRMLEDHWIERVGDDFISNRGEGHERKQYRLTELGRSILDLETERLKKLVNLTVLRDTVGQ
jgi:DNA-binding PadR family transcriptional regulator